MVRERGPKVAVFAAGGTTRWFILNYLTSWPADMCYWQGYLDQGGQRFLDIAQMFFDHGVHTLFTHAIVPGQLEGKGADYLPLALSTGMQRIAGTPEFLEFYEAYGVKVRFFGNYREVLENPSVNAECHLPESWELSGRFNRNAECGWENGGPVRAFTPGAADTLARFDELMERTQTHEQHVLYWGFNSERDLMTPIFSLVVQYYRDHGRMLSREEVIELVYGEPVQPVDIYVGFNRPRIANLMPPLLDHQADLYFTVGLSFDFSQRQLRSILYDHLYARRGWHRNYGELPSSAFAEMQGFYGLNREGVIGVGRRYEPGDIWHPLPQVRLPSGWGEEEGEE